MDGRSVKGHAVVVGAGTMGAQIAAHLANAGWRATLLDIVPKDAGDSPKERNAFAAKGLERALKARPAAFYNPEFADRIKLGNITDDLKAVKTADWVLEAVVEKPDIKRDLHAKIDALVGPNTVVATNTSGLSIAEMSANCSESYRKRFFGAHFFNPPRYLKLLELIPTPDTDPEQIRQFQAFAEAVLGKRVIIAKDTPGFIANRMGMFAGQVVQHATFKHGLTIEEVDYLTGPLIGHPKSGTFRLSDIVGLDVSLDVANNLRNRLTDDKWIVSYEFPNIAQKLVDSGRLGEKTGAGFYRREADKSISSLDLETLEYRPQKKASFPALDAIKNLPLPERLRALAKFDDKAGQFFWDITRDNLLYAADIAASIADDLPSIDNGLKWGYAHEVGPFEIWDILGVKEVAERAEKDGKAIPPLVTDLLRSGKNAFYAREEGKKFYADIHNPATQVEAPNPPEYIVLSDLKEQNKVIKKTADATLLDIGDGVSCLEFHTKMNVLGPGIISMIKWSREYVETNGVGLVIGNQGENFSAGFNIALILMGAQEQDWDEMALSVASLQNTLLDLKRSKIPVVTACHGLTLGGGCEVALHSSAVQAAGETYMGLPEAGIGVLPGGGGTTELTVRALKAVPTKDTDPFPFLHEAFVTMGMAKISTSAEEARGLGFLRPSDGVTLGTDRILYEAKQRVLALAHASYHPPQPETVLALGEDMLARFDVELHVMARSGFISEHDKLVAHNIAWVMCGGNFVHPQLVSEEYLLGVEREAFVRLCSTPKTLARLKHMLETGKPLRN